MKSLAALNSDECFLIALCPQRRLYSKKRSYFKNVSCSWICFYNHRSGDIAGTESILIFGCCHSLKFCVTVSLDSAIDILRNVLPQLLYFYSNSNDPKSIKIEQSVQSHWWVKWKGNMFFLHGCFGKVEHPTITIPPIKSNPYIWPPLCLYKEPLWWKNNIPVSLVYTADINTIITIRHGLFWLLLPLIQ